MKRLILLIASISVFITSCEKKSSSEHTPRIPVSDQTRFEYKVHLLPQFNAEQESELNKLGREGWELVLIETQLNNNELRGRSYTAFMKRLFREPTTDAKQ